MSLISIPFHFPMKALNLCKTHLRLLLLLRSTFVLIKYSPHGLFWVWFFLRFCLHMKLKFGKSECIINFEKSTKNSFRK